MSKMIIEKIDDPDFTEGLYGIFCDPDYLRNNGGLATNDDIKSMWRNYKIGMTTFLLKVNWKINSRFALKILIDFGFKLNIDVVSVNFIGFRDEIGRDAPMPILFDRRTEKYHYSLIGIKNFLREWILSRRKGRYYFMNGMESVGCCFDGHASYAPEWISDALNSRLEEYSIAGVFSRVVVWKIGTFSFLKNKADRNGNFVHSYIPAVVFRDEMISLFDGNTIVVSDYYSPFFDAYFIEDGCLYRVCAEFIYQ